MINLFSNASFREVIFIKLGDCRRLTGKNLLHSLEIRIVTILVIFYAISILMNLLYDFDGVCMLLFFFEQFLF